VSDSETTKETKETLGFPDVAVDVAATDNTLSVKLPRGKRVTPFTIVLLVMFSFCTIIFITVLSMDVIRDYFTGEGALWIIRVGLMLILAILTVTVIEQSLTGLRYTEGVLSDTINANRHLRLLMEAGREIGSTLDLPEILESILDCASDATSADIGVIYLQEKDKDILRLAMAKGVDESDIVFKELPMKVGLVGEAASWREMVSLDSTNSIDERDNVFFGVAEPLSEMIVPLVLRDKLLGMLIVANFKRHSYSIEEERLLDGIGELASVAIMNARLYRVARKSLDVLSRERNVIDTVLDEMVAGIITTNKHGRITVFNREAQNLTGYTFAEMTQVLLRPEVSLDENPLGPIEHKMLEVLKNRSLGSEGDATIMKADGSLLTVSYRIYPLVDGPEVTGAACVFMKAKDAATVSSDEDIIDFQMLVRSLGAKVEQTYANPLSRVIERLRNMSASDWSSGRENLVNTLEAGNSTLLGLLEDLEQYLNCTTIREWDAPKKHDLAAMTTQVVREAVATHDAQGLAASVELSGLPPVFGYERMIRTALEQVIENACVAALMGEKRIKITGCREDGFARLEISDTGPGLSSESREFMYVPFYTGWEGHSGLGLSMARRTMRKLGGKIGVIDDASKGTTFFLHFPT